jgi:hypothetical protein
VIGLSVAFVQISAREIIGVAPLLGRSQGKPLGMPPTIDAGGTAD